MDAECDMEPVQGLTEITHLRKITQKRKWNRCALSSEFKLNDSRNTVDVAH